MVNLAPFPYQLTPMNNISPPSYRDGMTYTRGLEQLKDWLNTVLVPGTNDAIADALAQFQAGLANAEQTITDTATGWDERYAAFLTNFTNEIRLLNEAAVGGMVADTASVVHTNLMTIIDAEILAVSAADRAYTDTEIAALDTATADGLATKLDTTDAAATYLGKTDAAATYLTKTDAGTKYPTKQAVVNALPPERRKTDKGGAVTAFLGDSYTSGVGPSQQNLRWSSRYAAAVNTVESNHAVSSAGYVNQGVTGSGKTANQAGAIPTNAARVIVCAGINDTSFTTSQVAAGVTDTIGAIRTRVPNAEIVVISPMWWNSQPTDAVREVERTIRNNLPADVRYVEGGLWLRQNRPDMQTDDGHPNDLGSLLIARWVEAKLDNTGPGGALEGSFERDGLNADETITSAGAGVGLAFGTVYDARPGKWRLSFDLAAYGTSDGFVWVSVAGQRLPQRWGINTGGTYPLTAAYSVEVRHPGGDLVIEGGMTMNAPVNVLETGTRIKARWVSE